MSADYNSVFQRLVANGLDPVTARNRLAAAISGGYDYADTLHNVYLDYGYPTTVTFYQLWNMYRRFGVAKAVVDLPVNVCWVTQPEIEGSDAFNRELQELIDRTAFWQRLKGLDLRQRVGRYAGLFVRVRDGLSPDKPLEGKLPGPGAIAGFVPLYENQLQVVTTDQDITSDRYGLPTMYQFSGSGAGNRNEKSQSSYNIHYSRVVIAAEGADDGGIYGIPALEPVFNSLMDLRKIIGAGGEGFYRNAAQSIVYELNDAANAIANASLLDEFNEQADDFMQNRMRRSMWTPGMKANLLQSSLSDPSGFFNAALNDVAAGSGIPATILIGQQTGRLASDQDSTHLLSMSNSRRATFLTDVIISVIDWLVEYGALPASDYEVEWDDLLEQSDAERLANAASMASINQTQFQSGGDPVFNVDEIRDQAGYDELTPGEFDDDSGEEFDPLEMDTAEPDGEENTE